MLEISVGKDRATRLTAEESGKLVLRTGSDGLFETGLRALRNGEIAVVRWRGCRQPLDARRRRGQSPAPFSAK